MIDKKIIKQLLTNVTDDIDMVWDTLDKDFQMKLYIEFNTLCHITEKLRQHTVRYEGDQQNKP